MRSGRCARAVRKTQIGFTLIELMVVVGLVAILTAIAMPSYTDYIKRGQIVDDMAEVSAGAAGFGSVRARQQALTVRAGAAKQLAGVLSAAATAVSDTILGTW